MAGFLDDADVFKKAKIARLPVIMEATLRGGNFAPPEIAAFTGTGEGLFAYFCDGYRKIQEELA